MSKVIIVVTMMFLGSVAYAGPCAAIKICNSGHRVSCTSSHGNCYQTYNGVSCGGGFLSSGRAFTATCPSHYNGNSPSDSYGENAGEKKSFVVLSDGASVFLEDLNISIEDI